MKRVAAAASLIVAAATTSCSYQPVAGATIPSPLVAQVAGTWSGSVTLQKVSAPQAGTYNCVGTGLANTLNTSAATTNVTMVLAQSGADVTATITPEGSGLACTYKGTAGPGTMTLNATNCDAPLIVVRCSAGDLSVNQATLIGTSITASVSKGIADGTVAQTFNVMDAGGDPAAGLTTTSALTAVRR